MEEIITSRENAQVKRAVRLLSSRVEREQSGLFVAEGLRLCLDAAESGVAIRQLLLTQRAGECYPETAALRAAAAQTLVISESVADKIADTKHPQGIFALCEKLDNSRCAVTIKGGGRYLLLDHLQDPGNLGTILRTADAMGTDGVFLSRDSADPFSPKVLRGSMGGLFRLPVEVADDLKAQISRLRESGIPVYAAALTEDATPLGEVDFSPGGAVLVGNEGNGLSDGMIRACSGSLVIPMAGGANSLNAGIAAGILLWEMSKSKS